MKKLIIIFLIAFVGIATYGQKITALPTATTAADASLIMMAKASEDTLRHITKANYLSGWAKLASPVFTGTVTIPTPFTLGATSVTTNGTELNLLDGVTTTTTQFNYLNAATGTTGTTSSNLVFSASPTLTAPALGTPSALVGTNITGTAASLTAGSVTGFTPASGSLTLSGADALILTTTAETNVTLPTTGTLATTAITDLKADANNAALTGTPTAPTASQGTNTTQIATTAYVQGEITAGTSLASVAPLLTDTINLALLGCGVGLAGDTVLIDDALNGYGYYQVPMDSTILDRVITTIPTGDSCNYYIVSGTTLWTPIDTLVTVACAAGETITTSFSEDTYVKDRKIWIEMGAVVVTRKPVKFRSLFQGRLIRNE